MDKNGLKKYLLSDFRDDKYPHKSLIAIYIENEKNYNKMDWEDTLPKIVAPEYLSKVSQQQNNTYWTIKK